MKKAVALISGGADSATTLAIALQQGFEVHAISFDYGQKHRIELEKSKLVAQKAASHKVIKLDPTAFQRSALTNNNLNVPKYDSVDQIPQKVADTYVPARNLLFLSYATSYAESIGASSIFIGVHKEDFANYPDTRPEFIKSFQEVVNCGTDAQIKIYAPLIDLDKDGVIAKGKALGVDYSNTITCYKPDDQGRSCGKCIACLVRLAAFKKNNLVDTIPYRQNP
ncbi:trans-regulatory protein ExsB [Candidatus Phycorickettsia trachydisci]|uniref:7-cyano-7-deazaguanine synthase n=1 Tax=Candidatus Phycorickettsia trachydisci TaxID=2115978 RepID=A0A2P1P7D4_9RICK|nr:7-cyano-7-deazaguanine synthase QueC [Candidatus Phycorickettsia trachydisci]AVP87181.1 trans-regulatory protein ExsB [Candidatus Phycorickettsia trachydisci]